MPGQSCCTPVRPIIRSTRLKDIVRWVDLSEDYVLGYGFNEEGEEAPFAVFDKTFTAPSYSQFWKSLIFVSLGMSPSKDGLSLPAEFWKNVKLIWKPGKKPSEVAPESVDLSDVDWVETEGGHAPLHFVLEALRKTTEIVSESGDLPLQLEEDAPNVSPSEVHEERDPAHSILAMRFKRQSEGHYKSEHHSHKGFQPVKVIDLHSPRSSLRRAGAWAMATSAVQGLAGAIPLYPVAQLIGASIEQVFHSIDLLYLCHQSRVLQLVEEALAGNSSSPFVSPLLNSEQLKKSVFYSVRTYTAFSSVFGNMCVSRNGQADRFLAQQATKRAKGLAALKKLKKVNLVAISGTEFALAWERANSSELSVLKIYALTTAQYSKKKLPYTTIDFLRPDRELRLRILQNEIQFASNFLYIPLPGISSVMRMIYKEAFMRQVDKRERHEAALEAHFKYNPGELAEMFVNHVGLSADEARQYESRALEILQKKRLNPIDMNAEEESRVQIKVETWIQQRDPQYRPMNPAATDLEVG